jgi:acyl-coenzyme A synthetase/AMP-(fatty) acid ligase
VLKDNNLSVEELKAWINGHIEARYQKVSFVIIVNELPRNVAGKILKKDLKETYINEHV